MRLEILQIFGVISMVVGVFLAIGQWDMKRLFAYHSISQIGYIILGVGLGTYLGILGGLLHLINHALFKSLHFLTSGAVVYSTGTRDLRDLGGLKERMPVTAVSSMVASMSIAGVPPFNGFWSKLLIILACIETGHLVYAFLAILVSIITLASFLKVQRYVFFGELKEKWKKVQEVPLLMRLAMIILAILCSSAGLLLLPQIKGVILDPAIEVLRNPTKYSSFVLGD